METWNDVKYHNFIYIYVDTESGIILGYGHLDSWGLHGFEKWSSFWVNWSPTKLTFCDKLITKYNEQKFEALKQIFVHYENEIERSHYDPMI